jgi:hypothetical protein
MTHLTADAMTSGPAPAIHAGLNAQICKFGIAGTASGSQTVALTALPAGAEVVGVNMYMSNDGYGTGGEHVSVFATIGGLTIPSAGVFQFIQSSTVGTNVVSNIGKDFGKRITASANMFLSFTSNVGTGTASCDVVVIVEYLKHKRGG